MGRNGRYASGLAAGLGSRPNVGICCVPKLRGCAFPGWVAGQRRLGLDNSVPSGIIMPVRVELSCFRRGPVGFVGRRCAVNLRFAAGFSACPVEKVRVPRFRGWAEESQARQFRPVWNYHAGSGRIVWGSKLSHPLNRRRPNSSGWPAHAGLGDSPTRGRWKYWHLLRAPVEKVLIPGLSDWVASSRARQFRAVSNYRAGSGRIV